MKSTWKTLLRERFGHDSAYPIQIRVFDRLLDTDSRDRNALVVLPTGSGKSLCYQLPALALRAHHGDGVTLVFSPLIALMEDQVASLKKRDIAAEYVNSTVAKKERGRRYDRLAKGDYDLFYATPERMAVPAFRDALARVPGGVRLLAIDEAHCISKWGHDLRPAYARVGDFRRELGSPPTVALTATATEAVREDIRAVLDLDASRMPMFASGIDRPNLALVAEEVWSDDDKVSRIVETARKAGGVGVVYFALIKELEAYADILRRSMPGVDHAIYHGRLEGKQKRRVYRDFMRASAERPMLLCATNAFGMGVDKPDLRYIVHAQVPGSVEAYYQEVGRAGRDGEPSRCVLLYQQQDLAVQQDFIEWSNPSADLLASIMAAIHARYAGEAGFATFTPDDIRLDVVGKGHAHGQSGGRIEQALITLESIGAIEQADVPGAYRFLCDLPDDAIDAASIAEKRQRDLMRLLDVVKLAKSRDIRGFVLDYFGLDGV